MANLAENVRVTWYFEHGDEDMSELGFILRSLIECPFIVAEVEGMSKNRYEQILSEPVIQELK